MTWTTNEASTSTVNYGTSAGTLGSSFGNSVMVTAHSLTVPGLTPGTQYFYPRDIGRRGREPGDVAGAAGRAFELHDRRVHGHRRDHSARRPAAARR